MQSIKFFEAIQPAPNWMKLKLAKHETGHGKNLQPFLLKLQQQEK